MIHNNWGYRGAQNLKTNDCMDGSVKNKHFFGDLLSEKEKFDASDISFKIKQNLNHAESSGA